MQLTFRVDTVPLVATLGRLATVAATPTAAGPVRDALLDAGRSYMADQRARFKSASAGDGTWVPLAAATIYQRLRAAGNPAPAVKKAQADPRLARAVAAALPLLYVSGALYTSLYPGEAGNVEEVLPDGVRIGTANRIARFQQDGTPRMPARPVLGPPSDRGLAAMRSLIAAGLAAAAAR